MCFRHHCSLVWLLVTLTLVAGCGVTDRPKTGEILGLVDISAVEAYDLVVKNRGNHDFSIIDVRTPREFAEGHIEGAVLIDYQAPDFREKINALDRAKTYLVYCRTGNRSRGAVTVMQSLGFNNIYHMVDGIVAWQGKGYPVVR